MGAAKLKGRFVECIRHFTPSWFAAIMGTGAISILWYNFPYAQDSKTIQVLTYIFFFLNLSLFVLFNILTVLRYFMFPEIWLAMIHHPTQSLFLGTYPMGVTTLINVAAGFIYTVDGFGGKGFLYTVWVIWWIDVALSALCAYGVIHFMFTRQKHTFESVSATWLLPVVPLIVISSSGGLLAAPLLQFSVSNSMVTLVFSTILLINGLTLALMMLTLYFLRLLLHGLPRGSGVVTVYIPLGPLGQAGYSILLLGAGFESVLPLHSGDPTGVLRGESVGQVINVITLIFALILWAMATVWLIYGVMATADVFWHDRIHFKQAFWSLIFPNGVYANLTVELYRATGAPFFRVWGAIYSVATAIVWAWVFGRTCVLVYNGTMFRSPCLDDVEVRADAVEKDAKSRHAGCPLSDVEAARMQVQVPGGFVRECARKESSRTTLSSGRRTVELV